MTSKGTCSHVDGTFTGILHGVLGVCSAECVVHGFFFLCGLSKSSGTGASHISHVSISFLNEIISHLRFYCYCHPDPPLMFGQTALCHVYKEGNMSKLM